MPGAQMTIVFPWIFMVFSDQKNVFPEKINPLAKLWIVSGILVSEREKYLDQVKKWDWLLSEEYQNAGWTSFLFFPF
mgnify:CR=1 FL=1